MEYQKKKQEFYIYGKQPVFEAAINENVKITHLYINETFKKKSADKLHEIAHSRRIMVHKAPEKHLDQLVGDVNHQGFVALISDFPYVDIHDWLEQVDLESNPSILLLDELQDPHNVGAIIRTAAALGVGAVMLPKHRQVGVNATVMKTSAGAALHIPVIRIGNVNQVIKLLKDKGFWVASLDASGSDTLWSSDLRSPMVFVIGNEGKGVGEKTLEICDHVISIPMSQDVESLNASVSAAITLYEWKRQNKD